MITSVQPYRIKMCDERSRERGIQEASAILRRGGVIVCATDTGYLLGGNGLDIEAIRKVYQIKGRDFQKPIHLVVADMTMAEILVEFNEQAKKIFERFLPGPLTLILKKTAAVPDLLTSGLPGLGIRLPENDILLQLVQAANVPITATSANRSGYATPFSVDEVLSELGEAIEFVDLILDQGETRHAMPSTILDLTCSPPQILRKGPITAEMLEEIVSCE